MNRFTYWLVALLVIVAGVVGVIVFVQDDGEGEDGFDVELTDAEWVKWNEESEIVLIEYSDFQCPACLDRLDVIEDIEAEFGDYVKFVYRHLPLEGLHPNAKRAAMASEAAGLQGEFWAMHDLLFDGQAEWSSLSGSALDEKFMEYADEAGLDVEQFEDDLDSDAVKDAVESDMEIAEELELTGTPTFFLNDRKLSNSEAGYEGLRDLLTEEIRSQDDN